MPTPFACVVNLGCRVNRVESDRITAELSREGFALVDEEQADIIVINTCAVTGEAETKTRKAVRHAAALPRHPQVIVTGCVVNLHAGALTQLSDRVIAEPSKLAVPRVACGLAGLAYEGEARGNSTHDVALGELLGRSRLGVKIQDGCNHRCSYCIVWKARGPERSVPVDAVLSQVRDAAASGIQEVVLTGVNLGAYDGVGPTDTHVEIDELLDTILEQTDIGRVRLSSIEPMDVSLRLIEFMAAAGDRVAPFLHLPVQSGCTSTLKRMYRPYTAERFMETVGRIRDRLPQIALSCDVIAGFPGETDEEFESTLATCREVGFSRMHVFRYSARPGTPAATMPDQVDPRVMAERAARLRDLARELACKDARRRIGSEELAVMETSMHGTLGSFHRIEVDDARKIPEGSLARVAIVGMDDDDALHGRLVSDEG